MASFCGPKETSLLVLQSRVAPKGGSHPCNGFDEEGEITFPCDQLGDSGHAGPLPIKKERKPHSQAANLAVTKGGSTNGEGSGMSDSLADALSRPQRS